MGDFVNGVCFSPRKDSLVIHFPLDLQQMVIYFPVFSCCFSDLCKTAGISCIQRPELVFGSY